MTNAEYIISKMTDRNLGDMLSEIIFNTHDSNIYFALTKATDQMYETTNIMRENFTIELQIWLSKQYTGDWKI